MTELWYSVHQHGNDLCLSPGWPTKDEAIATGRLKASKFLGVICSGWMHPSASAASAGPRLDKLLDDLRAIPDAVALIEDELRYSIGQLMPKRETR